MAPRSCYSAFRGVCQLFRAQLHRHSTIAINNQFTVPHSSLLPQNRSGPIITPLLGNQHYRDFKLQRGISVSVISSSMSDEKVCEQMSNDVLQSKSEPCPLQSIGQSELNEKSCGTDGQDNNENRKEESRRNKKGKKSSKWSWNKGKRKKKDPWYRNRGEQKRQKPKSSNENGDNIGKREDDSSQGKEGGDNDKADRPKINHWKQDFDADSQTPHEGSFAHPNMQKLFNVKIDAPAKESNDIEGSGAQTKVEDSDKAPEETGDQPNKQPKRKLALLVSFLGTNYSGFQINGGKHTLQAELELALYHAGIISETNFGYPHKVSLFLVAVCVRPYKAGRKSGDGLFDYIIYLGSMNNVTFFSCVLTLRSLGQYSWSSSARTDKGVHAAAQVCSVKGVMTEYNENAEINMKEQFEVMRGKINSNLPDDVRVLDVERVTRNFCARTVRNKVRYQYMVPSFLLCSREHVRSAFADIDSTVDDATSSNLTPMAASKIVESSITPDVMERARATLVKHRVTSDELDSLNEALKMFEGTHSFHNYTRRIGADNASAMRYIMSFVALDPIILPGTKNKEEESQWIPVQVTGQSFLLNQIRKMISAAVDLGRGAVSKDKIESTLRKDSRIKVNVAPAQGLFLDRSYFDVYNRHKANKGGGRGEGHDHDRLEWAGNEEFPAVQRIEEFKSSKIIPHIVKEERDEGNFLKYIFAQDCLYANDMYSLLDNTNLQDHGNSESEDDDSDNQ